MGSQKSQSPLETLFISQIKTTRTPHAHAHAPLYFIKDASQFIETIKTNSKTFKNIFKAQKQQSYRAAEKINIVCCKV